MWRCLSPHSLSLFVDLFASIQTTVLCYGCFSHSGSRSPQQGCSVLSTLVSELDDGGNTVTDRHTQSDETSESLEKESIEDLIGWLVRDGEVWVGQSVR